MTTASESKRLPFFRGPWAPLRNPLFRALWLATLFSNLGTWIHEVSSSWMMTELNPDPWMVSLVQVATTTPMFILALPAGALADVVDRRRWLLMTQSWMMLTALCMAFLAFSGQLGARGLLLGTAILSIGSALNSPAWHSVLPSIVSRQNLPAAVNLNGLAISLARAMGPGVAGLLLMRLNPAWGFALNTVSFAGILVVLWMWRPKQKRNRVRSERFFSALRVGLQHVRHSPRMRQVLVRAILFVFGSAALWALLPLLVRQQYAMQADHFGLMVALFGLGAAAYSATGLPKIRQRLNLNSVVDFHWTIFALVMVGLSQSPGNWIPFLLMFLGGCCWIGILSSLHYSVQSVAPAWVRARALSVYLLCYFAAASSGSAVWGKLATSQGVRSSLLWAGVGLGAACLSSLWFPVRSGEGLDLTPSRHWPDPDLKMHIEPEQGPVLVTVEYKVRLDQAEEFREAMQALKEQRMQHGVLRWGLFVDIEDPELYREVYLEENWEAHLRQHDRVTSYEKELGDRAYAYHMGDEMPRVQHLLLVDEP